ncbi:hypothetical protein I317_04505 [Kwoniella heveanensis CBS 569]|uniref:NAD(P)-binding protein n=1 Tax=Kwoniella heveanensis BCC8398 TaxID=1296120 RepID=A0A1B9H294_9TREE|nr:hypothetical protein I316_00511 [Kwoniella heveanensis BCC8398]OCF41699.1 hypothetical protein I317_04505 [Kwoniella heveanensis CBS 569]
MSVNAQKTILITGANRGIGYALTEAYLKKGYRVIAAVRDVAKAPKLDGLIVVKIDSASTTDPKEAVEQLQSQGIAHIDIIVANAGISSHYKAVKDIQLDAFQEHHIVNVQGPLLLFQAFYPLLKEGDKFIVISSLVGAQGIEHYPNMTAYSSTKATINFISRSIHFEEPHLTSFTINPGWLDTDMGEFGAKSSGLKKAPQKLVDTLPGIVDLIDVSTREDHSGYMWSYDGTKAPF